MERSVSGDGSHRLFVVHGESGAVVFHVRQDAGQHWMILEAGIHTLPKDSYTPGVVGVCPYVSTGRCLYSLVPTKQKETALGLWILFRSDETVFGQLESWYRKYVGDT